MTSWLWTESRIYLILCFYLNAQFTFGLIFAYLCYFSLKMLANKGGCSGMKRVMGLLPKPWGSLLTALVPWELCVGNHRSYTFLSVWFCPGNQRYHGTGVLLACKGSLTLFLCLFLWCFSALEGKKTYCLICDWGLWRHIFSARWPVESPYKRKLLCWDMRAALISE